MDYLSTRGDSGRHSFTETVFSGLARDGGLFVPESLPVLPAKIWQEWQNYDWEELAFAITKIFVGREIPETTQRELIHKSFANFSHSPPAPLRMLGHNLWLCELFHGPTLAFKDYALQWIGQLLNALAEKNGSAITLLGATSGDTGSAAIEACRNHKRMTLFMLHPLGRVSEFQRRQMTTHESPNIHNIAIDGKF